MPSSLGATSPPAAATAKHGPSARHATASATPGGTPGGLAGGRPGGSSATAGGVKSTSMPLSKATAAALAALEGSSQDAGPDVLQAAARQAVADLAQLLAVALDSCLLGLKQYNQTSGATANTDLADRPAGRRATAAAAVRPAGSDVLESLAGAAPSGLTCGSTIAGAGKSQRPRPVLGGPEACLVTLCGALASVFKRLWDAESALVMFEMCEDGLVTLLTWAVPELMAASVAGSGGATDGGGAGATDVAGAGAGATDVAGAGAPSMDCWITPAAAEQVGSLIKIHES